MKKFIKDLFEVIICSVLIVFVLFKFFVMPCQVYGRSMEPTLKDNQRCYSFIITKNISINRFDISVIDVSDNDNDKLLVKRVIGLPNETLEYKDNKLYINGNYVNEYFIENKYTDDFKIELKDDEYFCMGDNREISKDSRYYGPFSKEQIISTKMLVVYPFSDFGVRK